MNDLPPTGTLEPLLARFVGDGRSRITIASRDRNDYESTFPTEIVTCRVEPIGADGANGGGTIKLLCKYSGERPIDGGRSLGPEAYAHRWVAERSGSTVPRLYGVDRDASSGALVMVFEFVDAEMLEDAPWPAGLETAAAWIGRFHGYWESRLDDPLVAALPRFDGGDHARLLDSVFQRISLTPGRPAASWLLDRQGGIAHTLTAVLAAAPRTVLHGDFFPDNILVRGTDAWPVDWERASVGPGEMDLASLVDGWGEESEALAVTAYAASRPSAVEGLPFRLAAARLHTQLTWLARVDGERPDRWPARVAAASAAAASLGIG